MEYTVEITEILKMQVNTEAENPYEAEHIVSDKWRKSEYILDADNFVEASFTALEGGSENEGQSIYPQPEGS